MSTFVGLPELSDEDRAAADREIEARERLEAAAERPDRTDLLNAAAALLSASRFLSETDPIYGLGVDHEIACGLLLDRGDEVRAAILGRLVHECHDTRGRLRSRPFRELPEAHLRRCRWAMSNLADLRIVARDWRPLPEPALSLALGPSGAFDRDSGSVRPRANLLAAFAARDAGRARRALSHIERNHGWGARLLAGALYAEAAKLELLDLPERYSAFAE